MRLSQVGAFQRLAHALTMADHRRVGRDAHPTGCVMDAQAARSGGVGMASERGYDPARRFGGRKRHTLTDTDGHLHVADVSPADLHGVHGGIALLPTPHGLFLFLTHCFVGRADRGERVGPTPATVVEINECESSPKGLAVQRGRWGSARTLSWISRRRLACGDEATAPPGSASSCMLRP